MRTETMVVLLLALCRCAGSSGEAPKPAAPQITSAELAPRTATPVSYDARALERVTEPQAIGLVISLDRGFIEQGTLAESRATDPRVKKVAALMVRDHQAMLHHNLVLAHDNNIVPADSDKGRQLRADARQRLHELEQTQADMFDARYVYDQVTGHIEALVVMDARVLPNVKTSELQTQAQRDKTRLTHHLAELRDLQRHMSQGVAAR
jgi:predicted outer membrane protein